MTPKFVVSTRGAYECREERLVIADITAVFAWKERRRPESAAIAGIGPNRIGEADLTTNIRLLPMQETKHGAVKNPPRSYYFITGRFVRRGLLYDVRNPELSVDARRLGAVRSKHTISKDVLNFYRFGQNCGPGAVAPMRRNETANGSRWVRRIDDAIAKRDRERRAAGPFLSVEECVAESPLLFLDHIRTTQGRQIVGSVEAAIVRGIELAKVASDLWLAVGNDEQCFCESRTLELGRDVC